MIPLLALAVLAWVRYCKFIKERSNPIINNHTLPQICVQCIYRLALHPLSKYPGPKLAALTSWHPTFFVSRGDLHEQTLRWHAKYGIHLHKPGTAAARNQCNNPLTSNPPRPGSVNRPQLALLQQLPRLHRHLRRARQRAQRRTICGTQRQSPHAELDHVY